ncbi:MAG TPA: Rv3235 family protein [Dermatophilaceae bacterium]
MKLIVRPIPDISPPVIDSRTAVIRDPSPFIQGTLAVDFNRGYDTLQDPGGRDYFGPQRTLSRQLPEPEAWVTHMAQALVEVMSGARPAPQVIRWTTTEVYAVLARRNAVSGRRATVARRALVRRVRICEPADGVVEACAVVVDNGRVRAIAMRLTGVDRRWVVSELQVG